MKFSRKALIGVAATVGALAVGGGIAFAVWTVQGAGNGTAGATVAQNLTVTAVTPTGTQASLYPGGPAAGVFFQVANPNPFAVTITGVSYGSPTSNNTTSCATANVSIDAGAPSTVSISIPANTPAGTVYSVPGVLDMAHTAPNSCQGVTFNVPITLSATQQ